VTGAHPALVLLPGLAGHAGEFDALAGHLGPDHRTMALDPFTDGDLTLAGRVRRIADRIAGDHEAPVVLLGHSAGGITALAVAAQHPDLLAGLVVLDSPVLLPAPVRLATRAPLALLSTPLARPLLRGFFRATFTDADPPPWRAEVLDRLAATSPGAARALTRSTFLYDSATALAGLGVPALVVRANIPVRLDRLPPAVQGGDVPGVGHWPHVHAPARVAAALEQFLSAGLEKRHA
jgi:pimeloyl-ACP methyl ester carboxylesterase